jgi:hypothetical protein
VPLNTGRDFTLHAGDGVVELRMCAEIATHKLFKQSTAEPFLGRRCDSRSSDLFPIQVQRAIAHVPF